MSITAAEVMEMALKVETNIAALYHDIADNLAAGSEESKFFTSMAAQEHIHAGWVEDMFSLAEPAFQFPGLESSDFSNILGTIEDVHDEVVSEHINIDDAKEILFHLETSTAEEFYRKFPKDIPGLPNRLVDKMIKSCEKHAVAVRRFCETHTGMPEDIT